MIFATVGLAGSLVLAEPDSFGGSESGRDKRPKLRLIFLSTLQADDPLILASPTGKEGVWIEHGEVEARAPLITEWYRVRAGELHLAQRTADGLVSKGRMIFPSGPKVALAVVDADLDRQVYRAKVIDPVGTGFGKGSTLVMNLSREKGFVRLGETRVEVEPGRTVVAKPVPEANGMYALLAGYRDADNKLVLCYDRYVPHEPGAREYMFLVPDPTLGLRVFTLPEFGEQP